MECVTCFFKCKYGKAKTEGIWKNKGSITLLKEHNGLSINEPNSTELIKLPENNVLMKISEQNKKRTQKTQWDQENNDWTKLKGQHKTKILREPKRKKWKRIIWWMEWKDVNYNIKTQKLNGTGVEQ